VRDRLGSLADADVINDTPALSLFLSIARPLAATKAKMSLSQKASNGAPFRLPVDNIRAKVAIVAQ